MLYHYWKHHRKLWNSIAKNGGSKIENILRFDMSIEDKDKYYDLNNCGLCSYIRNVLGIEFSDNDFCYHCLIEWTDRDKLYISEDSCPCEERGSYYNKFMANNDRSKQAALIALQHPKQFNYGQYSW